MIMKRLLFDFANKKTTIIGDDVSDADVSIYMERNKYRVMYVWFNGKETKGDNN